MRFNNSVDEKNVTLLNEIEAAGIQLEFEIRTDLGHWGVQSRQKFAIAAPNENPSPQMFAHELLHIKLNVLGFLTTPVVMDMYGPENCHFDTTQIGNIQNQLAHIKMLPLFVQMGYAADRFIANHGKEFFLNELFPSIDKLRGAFEVSKMSGLKPELGMITEFILNVICMKLYEVEYAITGKKLIDTDFLAGELKIADESLFNAIYEEVTRWTDAGTYRNYLFYQNLNYRLYQLGYPTESEWSAWSMQKG